MTAMAPMRFAFPARQAFLFPRVMCKALAEHLAQLAGDAALRDQLGRRGQAFVRENFAVETMVEKIYALYQKLAPMESK
jgi:glycosyltransferase involved in cell wall biosynthesis